MKLTDLEPQFLKRTKPVEYEYTDDIKEADALQLRCPACHWSFARGTRAHVHSIIIWKPEPELWQMVGHGYRDLSIVSGRLSVSLTTGCKSQLWIKNGRVDFC